MNTGDRLHALDAVRGFALILGIFFHRAAGYTENFPEQLWPMREPPSTTLGVVFFVSHMFRMSLFFLIAGFVGRMLIERRGHPRDSYAIVRSASCCRSPSDCRSS